MMCKLSRETVEDILRDGCIYEVGGAVRDRFMSAERLVKDRDYLVTGIDYDRLTRILRRHGRVDLVGKSFGVIKFTQRTSSGPYTFDITLPRKEHSTGVGHKDFAVDFDPSLPVHEDLVRRDFTINAMALAVASDELIDPLGGMVDLEQRRLRMTSPRSFVEDPLRMMRAVQFAARFEFDIEDETLRSMVEHAELLKTVSRERIAEELNKLLLRAGKPSIGFRLMQQTGLLRQFLPDLDKCVGVEQPGNFHRYDVFEHTLHTVDATRPKLRIRLAALFHDIRKPQCKRLVEKGASFYGHDLQGARAARRILRELRYPNDLIRDVEKLVERHMFTTEVTDKGLRRLVSRVGTDLVFDLLDLRRADVVAQGMGGTTEDVDEFEARIRAELARKSPFGYKDLALDGKEVMQLLDISEGPLVGEILRRLLDAVLEDPARNERGKLESLVREINLTTIDNRGRHKGNTP